MEKPIIYPIDKLPDFVKGKVQQIWEKHGIPLNSLSIVYTYFDGIYTAHEMPLDLYHHECVHYIQQGAGQSKEQADAWWTRYAEDADFRYQQEIEAYREQYKVVKNQKNKAVAFEAAKRFAMDLSSPVYGKICTFTQALMDIIRE